MQFPSIRVFHSVVVLSALSIVVACAEDARTPLEQEAEVAASLDGEHASLQCDANNGGITLPAGFCAIVFADLRVGGQPAPARHMAVTPNGDVFVAINSPSNVQPSFGIFGLRDVDGDGRADERTRFSPNLGGSGIAWWGDHLYFGANDRVLRFDLPNGKLRPAGVAEVVVSALPDTGDHISKTVVFQPPGTLVVNFGSASNSCQVFNRESRSPGVYPCPELDERAGIWLFDATGTNLSQSDGEHFATGLRNTVALTLNPADGQLYGIPHGRDDLFENWSQFYTIQEDAILPAEELVRITRGVDAGWPYCYFDAVFENRKVLAPEYGGNGQLVVGPQGIDCASYDQPIVAFEAHWAPNGLHFYQGTQFPPKYRGGLFIAFHGGHDRTPLPNEGYQVMFVPFSNGAPAGEGETFADNFAMSSGPLPATAKHRPVGLAEAPDGSLYISDDAGGRIWRVIYVGSERK